jgi:hypothetical protein
VPDERLPFETLVGEELSGVTFVRDYIQLQFNPPPILNIYNPVTVRVAHGALVQGHSDFANALIARIGTHVAQVNLVPDRSLELVLSDGCVVSISLLPTDFTGPEAAYLSLADGSAAVL